MRNKSLRSTALVRRNPSLARARIVAHHIDALFIGPNDLHLALFGTAPADFKSEPFLKVLDEIIAAGRRAGKPVGLLLPDGKQTMWAKKRWGSDLTMLAIGGDVKALVGWMGRELAEGKASD